MGWGFELIQRIDFYESICTHYKEANHTSCNSFSIPMTMGDQTIQCAICICTTKGV